MTVQTELRTHIVRFKFDNYTNILMHSLFQRIISWTIRYTH